MRDIEVLRAYRCAAKELALLERQMELFGSAGAPAGAKTVRLDAVRSTNHVQAAQLQHYDGLAALLERKRTELEQIALRFETILDGVKSPRLRLILRSYYALGMTDEAIAGEMGMTARRICELRNTFVRSLDMPEAA